MRKTELWKSFFDELQCLSSGKSIGNAGLAACAPNAPACCTPVGSPSVPHRRDNPDPPARGTDTAGGEAVGAGPREKGAPRGKPESFSNPPRRRKKTQTP